MRCESELKSFREFSKRLNTEPVMVFVNAVVSGRSRALTLLTCLEIDPDLEVHGPDRAWRANVRREFGKLVIVPLRLRPVRKGPRNTGFTQASIAG